jgi:CRP/FNR family cyclic AMP-dependent transcriptional regulator
MDDSKALLRQISFARALPDAALTALARIAQPLRQTAGALVQLEGEPAEAMYVVTAGRVRIYRVAANGREQVMNVIGAGGHFNTVPMFDGGPCPANVEAITDVALLALPRDPLLRVVEAHPPLALALLREFTGRLRGLVTQAEMAARLGTVREMIGRTLKSFEGQGLISLQRGTIAILDREGLEALREE